MPQRILNQQKTYAFSLRRYCIIPENTERLCMYVCMFVCMVESEKEVTLLPNISIVIRKLFIV